MEWLTYIHSAQIIIQRSIAFIGVLVILSGVIYAMYQYLQYFLSGQLKNHSSKKINSIRLNLGRILILGLEFIVAADLIGSTTTPDYYSVGILGIIVLIRTVLSYSLSREITVLNKET